MRRNIYVVSSLGLAIIIGALVIGAGIVTVHSQTGKPMGADDYSRLKHAAEEGFFWVPDDQVYRELNHREWWGGKLDPPHLVSGGFHADGTEMFVCRGIVKRDEVYAPGKLYKNVCLYPYGGKELTAATGYEVLLKGNDGFSYQWKPIDPSWHISTGPLPYRDDYTQLSFAAKGGVDQGMDPDLFMCRKQLKDGMHLGKYSPFYHFCYIPWGGKELRISITDGFDILLADPRPPVTKLGVKHTATGGSQAGPPFIVATPNNITLPFGQTAGVATLIWDAGPGHPYAEVWVKVDGRDETKVLKKDNGTMPVQIIAGSTYVYILTDAGTTLATVTVRFLR